MTVSPPPLPHDLEQLGAVIAAALVDGRGAGAGGWHAQLQAAADATHQDGEVLRLADEIHAAAPDLRTAAAVDAYARSTWITVQGGAARSLLHGMLLPHADVDEP